MTAIYFAGAEVETLTRALMDAGVKNVLYSYYYILTMRREDFIARIQQAYPHVNFFLDSGAFTYAVQFRERSHQLPPYQTYIQRYFQYIDEYGAPYCRITEPDLDGIRGFDEVTPDTVDEWREYMLERWPDLNIMPVWHGWRGPRAWAEYVADNRIRCLAIGRNGGPPGLNRRMVMAAHQLGKPVHGFAQTRINTTMKVIPWDSVDSTSWLMGQKYGTLYIFRNNKFITLSKEHGGKDKRKLYKAYFKNIGCDPRKIIEDDVAEVRKANVLAWKRVSDRFEQMRLRQNRRFDVDDTVGQGHDLYKPAGIPRLAELYDGHGPRARDRDGEGPVGARPRPRETESIGKRPLSRGDEEEVP